MQHKSCLYRGPERTWSSIAKATTFLDLLTACPNIVQCCSKTWVASIKVLHYEPKYLLPCIIMLWSFSRGLLFLQRNSLYPQLISIWFCWLFSLLVLSCTSIALQPLLQTVCYFIRCFVWFLVLENLNALQLWINSLAWFLSEGSPPFPTAWLLCIVPCNAPALPLCATSEAGIVRTTPKPVISKLCA